MIGKCDPSTGRPEPEVVKVINGLQAHGYDNELNKTTSVLYPCGLNACGSSLIRNGNNSIKLQRYIVSAQWRAGTRMLQRRETLDNVATIFAERKEG